MASPFQMKHVAFNDLVASYYMRRGSVVKRDTVSITDMGDAFDEPAFDVHAASRVRRRVFVIDFNAFPFGCDPEVGDTLTLANGATYAVAEIIEIPDAWSLTCKRK